MSVPELRVGFCKWPARIPGRYQVDVRLLLPKAGGSQRINTRVQLLKGRDRFLIDWRGTRSWLRDNLSRNAKEAGILKDIMEILRENKDVLAERALEKPINFYGVHESCKTIILFYETVEGQSGVKFGRIISRRSMSNPEMNVKAGIFIFANPEWKIPQFFILDDPDTDLICTPSFIGQQREQWLAAFIESFSSNELAVTDWAELREIDNEDELIRTRTQQLLKAHMGK